MKKNNRPRLSNRDVVLVTWIAQQSVCRLDTLAMVCENKNYQTTDRYAGVHNALRDTLCLQTGICCIK